MAILAKYVIVSSGDVNYLNLGFDFPDLSLSGQNIEYIGSSSIDTVFLAPGVEVDFSLSGGGQDRIYFSGSWDDYKDSLAFPEGDNRPAMSLERTVDGKTEKVLFRRGFSASASDFLVFADGVINARTLATAKAAAVPDPTNETSLNPDLPAEMPASVKMTNLSSDGLTFASVTSGMSQELLGGAGIDIVYIGEGAITDATSLSSGKDVIYLRGNFSDYSKDLSINGRIVLSRDHDDNIDTPDESVSVSAGFGSNDDQLVFADGAVTSTRNLRSTLRSSGDPDAVTTAQLGAIWDSAITTPGVVDSPVVVSFGTSTADGNYQTGEIIVITATMSKDVAAGSSFDIILDSGGAVTLTAASDGTLLTGNYVIGADDSSTDLAVASFEAGSVLDLEGNAMTSTALPPDDANIADNHDIIVNGLSLASVMNGVSNLDVRSDLVLSAESGEGLLLTTTPGVYEIRLVQRNDAGAKTGFGGQTADGSQTIVLTVDAEGAASAEGGSVAIVDGQAVIDFDRDFDLANSFILEADKELFVGAASGSLNGAIGADAIGFETITPGTDGTIAKIWDGAALSDGATWFDGLGGDYLGNEDGAVLDLSAVAGVVVIGRDIDDGASIVLDDAARAQLSGFGADDRLYIDHDVSANVNEVNETTIGISSVSGAPSTVLLFSSRDSQAGAFITFADDPNTTDLNESMLVAAAFFEDSLSSGASDYSFQEILNLQQGEAPVISG